MERIIFLAWYLYANQDNRTYFKYTMIIAMCLISSFISNNNYLVAFAFFYNEIYYAQCAIIFKNKNEIWFIFPYA